MAQKIKADVLQALRDWKAGKPVKSIELGHVHRMADNPNGGVPRVDLSMRFQNDQERAHAYCFHLIELFSINGVPEAHEAFLSACEDFDRTFSDVDNLTEEEEMAAQSLAWKALHVGWARAIIGHDPSMYIEVSNPAVVAAT